MSLILIAAVTALPAAEVPIGLNLAGVRDWSSEHPFVDAFRTARPWVPQREGAGWGKGEMPPLGDHGYPTRLKPGQFVTTIVLNARGYEAGRWVLLYDGVGRIHLGGGARPKVLTDTPGRVMFELNGEPGLFLDLRETDPTNPLRNVRVVPAAREADYEVEPFRASFLARCRMFPVVRFMDWMDTNGSEIESWEDRPKMEDFSWATHGVPVEVMVDLSNRIGCRPWFCVPHLADETYIRNFAEQVKRDLDPKLDVYVEHSNEVWNGQFAQARHAGDVGLKAGLSDNRYQAQLLHHARRSGLVFRTWKDVFGSRSDRVVGVLGSQSVNPWVSEQLVADPEVVRSADAIAVAPYFGNSLGDPKRTSEVTRMSVPDVLEFCRQAIRETETVLKKQKAICDQHGLELIAYEAGQHLVGHGGAENDEDLMNLFHAANRHPGMADLYREAVASWERVGGGLWCAFSSVGTPSKWGSWGLKEYEDQPAEEAPKWRAVVEAAAK